MISSGRIFFLEPIDTKTENPGPDPIVLSSAVALSLFASVDGNGVHVILCVLITDTGGYVHESISLCSPFIDVRL